MLGASQREIEMKRTILGAAVAAIFLAVSPMQGSHAAARTQPLVPQVTVAQNGSPVEAAQPKPSKSAESKSARAKSLHRAYAIRARMAKQKTKLKSLKAKKQLAKSKKQSLKSKKKQAA
jgi:hypothetical protein